MHEDKHLDLACWRINYSLHLTPHELYDYWQAHGTPTGAVLALKAAVDEIERLRAAVAAERERCCRVVVVQRDDRMWDVARRTILAIRAGDDYVGDVDDEGLLRA
jgi:hypothetical protein